MTQRPTLPFALTALAVALAGCQAAPPPRPLPPPAPAEWTGPEDEAEPLLGRDDAAPATEPVGPTVERGTGRFIDEQAATRRPRGPVEGNVTFNWEDAPIQVVIKAVLGDILQENYVIAPGVQGTVTFSTAKPISAAQARAVLETILQQNNLAMVYKDGRYTVLPVGQAIPGNLAPRLGGANARGYEVRVIPLEYIAATEMEKLLAPYVRQGAVIRADNARSMIVLAGTAGDLETYEQTIETFDVDWLKGMSVGVFPLERVEAGTVVPELEKIFGEGANTPLAGMFRFLPIERLNAVLVITPQPRYLEEAQRWLARLDGGGADAGTQLFVYYVKNVKAQDLADNLTDVFGGGEGSASRRGESSVAGIAPGLQPVEVRTVDTKPDGGTTDSARQAAGRNRPGGDGIALPSGENIRITAIEESNALLIKATPGEYESIQRAIKRLDVVPLQVHIEVKILSVDLNDSLNLGVEWYFENAFSSTGANNTATTEGFRRVVRGYGQGNDGDGAWNSFAGRLGTEGLKWTFVNTAAEALLSTLQSNGNARVLSAPSLVVLNNKEASINVGTQLPVVSSFISGINTGVQSPTDPTGGTVNPGVGQSYVQFRNTGITLKVTPRVNPGGLVFLEVSQEDSQPTTQVVGGNFAVSQRQVQTEIAVQSGQTVLLGGLIRDTDSTTRSGLPGLSRIPVIGALFGRQEKSNAREELLVVITPTVIESAEKAQSVTDEYRQRFRGLQPLIRKDEAETRGLPDS